MKFWLAFFAVTATLSSQTGGDQTTPLHWAVLDNDTGSVERLLDAGADPGARNRLGVTPLHLAATNGNAETIRLLLEAGADPNTALPEGETALMTAARTGRAEAIETLIEAGAEIDRAESWKGQTALMWAAAENNVEAIRLLADAGADIHRTSNGGTFTPFVFAVRGGHVEAAGALLDLGVDVNFSLPDGTSALVLAVFNAHYELAGFLLERGADPNADAQGWTALHQVAWSRRPNAGFNLPGARQTGDLPSLELVRRLVGAGADPDRRMTKEPADGNRNMLNRIGSTPFLMAAKSCDVPLMRLLLELGADPSIPNQDGTTAVMVAAGVGIWAPGENPGTHAEALAAVRLALEAGGGAVDDVDANGETVVHGAVYRGGAVNVIRFLADRGAPLDVVNRKGWTPLVAAEGVEYTPAVLKRYPEAAELLRNLMRERGLDVPPPGEAGRSVVPDTPLPTRTSDDGVFSTAQAERGRLAYSRECAACHFEDLLGDDVAPTLAGPAFWARWEGAGIHQLAETISTSMPPAAPGSVPTDTVADIIGYLLETNGSPVGAAPLDPNPEQLRRILLREPSPAEAEGRGRQ